MDNGFSSDSSRPSVSTMPSTSDLPLSSTLRKDPEMVIVGRRGSFIPIGESLRGAAEKVTQRAIRDRIKRLGDEYKANVGIATVRIDDDGNTVLEMMNQDEEITQVISGDQELMKDEMRANMFRGPEKAMQGAQAEPGAPIVRKVVKKVKEFTAEEFVEQSIRKLNANSILITKRKDEIVREKSKMQDLKERQNVVTNILRLEREISEVVLDTQKTSLERQPLEQQFDQIKKEHDVALAVLNNLLSLYGKLHTFKTSIDIQQSYTTQSVRGSLGSRLMLGSLGSRLVNANASNMSFVSLDRASNAGSSISIASSDHGYTRPRNKSTVTIPTITGAASSKDRKWSKVGF